MGAVKMVDWGETQYHLGEDPSDPTFTKLSQSIGGISGDPLYLTHLATIRDAKDQDNTVRAEAYNRCDWKQRIAPIRMV